MSTDFEHIVVNNNKDEQRYEAVVEGYRAVLTYSREGNTIFFLHAGVPRPIEGNGVASTITHYALEEAREQHLMVVPLCPFVAAYIREHEEFQSLVESAQ